MRRCFKIRNNILHNDGMQPNTDINNMMVPACALIERRCAADVGTMMFSAVLHQATQVLGPPPRKPAAEHLNEERHIRLAAALGPLHGAKSARAETLAK